MLAHVQFDYSTCQGDYASALKQGGYCVDVIKQLDDESILRLDFVHYVDLAENIE